MMGLVNSVVGFGKASVQMYAHFEKVENGLSGILGSAEEGAKMFEELRQFSFETTFGVDELADATTQLMQAGVASDTVKEKLTQLGNVAGGDKTKFAELVQIFAKINNTGKASAMQLQQLALRGVPIYQVLEQIGVKGTATANDIAAAFEKMTEEGGMFYNSMNSINETIEGKEGFVSDTFKEIQANFAEATGLVDLYKMALDGALKVAEFINDILAKIKENPVAKAVLDGILVSLATVVGVTLVAAFIKLNSVLAITAGLKAIISPQSLAIAGLIAGVSALSLGMVSAIGQANEETSKSMDNYKTLLNNMKEAREAYKENASIENTVSVKKAEIALDNQEVKEIEDELKFWKQENVVNEHVLELQTRLKTLQNGIKEAESKVAEMEASVLKTQGRTSQNKQYENNLKLLEQYSKDIDEMYQSSGIDEYQQKINVLTNSLVELQKLQSIKGFSVKNELGQVEFRPFSDETKKQIDELVAYTQEQLNNVRIDLAVDKNADWQKTLQNVLGFSNKQVYSLMQNGGFTTTSGVNEFMRLSDIQTEKLAKYGDVTGVNDYTALGAKIDSYKSILQALLKDKEYTGEEESIKQIVSKIESLQRSYDEQTKALEEQAKIQDLKDLLSELKNSNAKSLNELADKYSQIANTERALGNEQGYLSNTYASMGTSGLAKIISGSDMGTFVDTFMETGNVWASLSQVVLDNLVDIIGSLDGLDIILNPIKIILEKLTPALQAIINVLLPIFNTIIAVLSPIVQILGTALLPALKILEVVLKALLIPLQLVGKLLQWIASIFSDSINDTLDSVDELTSGLNDYYDTTSKLNKTTKDLTSQYLSLISAIKENQDYYLSEKKKLNAQAYINTTPVNDMIITPSGTFSTHPQDTIMAMKDPTSLTKSSNAVVNVQVNNNANADVNVSSTNENGIAKLIIDISKKVASDMATGANGWDNAYNAQQQRLAGRRVNV